MIDSGTTLFRSKFLINERKICDCKYYRGYPVFSKFVLPGDVWKIHTESFIRLQPMLSPTLTPNQGRIRFFFVPIRLVEEQTELIITGSKDGYFNKDVDIPSFDAWHITAPSASSSFSVSVAKHSVISYMTGLPVKSYLKGTWFDLESVPADYWRKAYWRIYWDYYRDENLDTDGNGDFDTFVYAKYGVAEDSFFKVKLPHDYFTKSLPWQLKGITPAMDFGSVYYDTDKILGVNPSSGIRVGFDVADRTGTPSFGLSSSSSQSLTSDQLNLLKQNIASFFTNVGLSSSSFNMSDLRDLSAQTRVFERLARCGSRYTEYLRANFGTAPADGTLQRAQYLGGVKFPIVTTEIPQTAQAQNSSGDETPVGTLRGKGISASSGSIKAARFSEFGVVIGIADFRPTVQYTQGLPREYSYKRRFDFFNPSFQHLSEQEVRNSEVFFDGTNDDDATWGYQLMYQELRTGKTSIVGGMRDTLKFWHQGIEFPSRPSLNSAFITGSNYDDSWNRVFEVVGDDSYPIIADFGFYCEVHRPMVRYGTPGLVDHL